MKMVKGIPVIFAIIAMILLVGCSSGIPGLTGVVYEWIDAPSDATSQLYIGDIPDGIKTIPIEGVIIDIRSKDLINNRITKKGKILISDSSGKFHGSWIEGDRFTYQNWLIKTQKEGYFDGTNEMIKPYEKNGRWSCNITILMVKK